VESKADMESETHVPKSFEMEAFCEMDGTGHRWARKAGQAPQEPRHAGCHHGK